MAVTTLPTPLNSCALPAGISGPQSCLPPSGASTQPLHSLPWSRAVPGRLISPLVMSAETGTHFVFAFLPRAGPGYGGEFHGCPYFLRALHVSLWPLLWQKPIRTQQFDADQMGVFSALI